MVNTAKIGTETRRFDTDDDEYIILEFNLLKGKFFMEKLGCLYRRLEGFSILSGDGVKQNC